MTNGLLTKAERKWLLNWIIESSNSDNNPDGVQNKLCEKMSRIKNSFDLMKIFDEELK
jgi:hypothetical protein